MLTQQRWETPPTGPDTRVRRKATRERIRIRQRSVWQNPKGGGREKSNSKDSNHLMPREPEIAQLKELLQNYTLKATYADKV